MELTSAFSPLFILVYKFLYLAIAVFGIGLLIGIHELGHFLFCKLFKIKTPSFSIGFGPKIFSKKIGGTLFSLSAIPLGGFVEIAGAVEVGQGEQKHALSQEPDSFAVKPYYQKLLVMLGGISFNLLFAYAVCIFLAFIGMPKTPLLYPNNAKTTIVQLEPGSPAEKAGLRIGDSIQSIDQITVRKMPLKLIQTVQERPKKQVMVSFKRNGQIKEVAATIGERTAGTTMVGSLGITALEMKEIPGRPFLAALPYGIALANAWIVQTVYGFLSIFKQRTVKGMGGPVALISMLSQGAASHFVVFLILLVIISINLAILNLIPLPILDGGQLLFYTIEAIAQRPLPARVREYIHIGSWILILMLIVYLSIQDVGRIISPYIAVVRQAVGW